MHVGASVDPAFKPILETAWFYHAKSGLCLEYDTLLDDIVGCDSDMVSEDVVDSTIHAFVKECVIQAEDGTELVWTSLTKRRSICSTFHCFEGISKQPTKAGCIPPLLRVFVKVCTYRFLPTSVLRNISYDSDDGVNTIDVVPTRFVCNGKIQIMERQQGDVNTVGLLPGKRGFLEFALWFATVLLKITRAGGVYADVKPENILLNTTGDGYYLGDVEVIRTCNSRLKHASTYPVTSGKTDVIGADALLNMVYGYVVTLFNLWHNKKHEAWGSLRLHHPALVMRDLVHSRLATDCDYTFDLQSHPYFTSTTVGHPDRASELVEIEEMAVGCCARLRSCLFADNARDRTVKFFVRVIRRLNVALSDDSLH
jgi:hypothetical protein